MSSGQIIVVLLFGGFGIVMTVGGLAFVIKTRRFVAAANRTAGKVLAYETESSDDTQRRRAAMRSDYRTLYFPIVEFKDFKGNQRRVKTSTGSSPASFSVGAAVTVLYDRDNPERAEIESFGELWVLPTALLGMGAFNVFIALTVWIFNLPVKVNFF